MINGVGEGDATREGAGDWGAWPWVGEVGWAHKLGKRPVRVPKVSRIQRTRSTINHNSRVALVWSIPLAFDLSASL